MAYEQQKSYFWILVLLYILNDFLFLLDTHYATWLIIDYSIRIFTIVAIFFLYKEYVLNISMLYLHRYSLRKTLSYGLSFSIIGILLFRIIETHFTFVNFYQGIEFPEITNPFWNVFDLSIGLLLVAFSEELLLHAYFYTLFKNRFNDRTLILLSALLFAAIHWSNDLSNIIGVFIWGMIAMKILIKTQSIWPLILAHFLTDFVLYAKLLPDSLFLL